MLYLLNNGENIRNMLETGGSGRDFDFSQFKGSLDVESAAVMGHSFGGATIIQTLSEDPRFMLVPVSLASCIIIIRLRVLHRVSCMCKIGEIKGKI